MVKASWRNLFLISVVRELLYRWRLKQITFSRMSEISKRMLVLFERNLSEEIFLANLNDLKRMPEPELAGVVRAYLFAFLKAKERRVAGE